MPYSEVIKLDLRVCIVDLNDSEWRISLTNFNKLENRFIKILDRYGCDNPYSPMPKFSMNERFRGYHIISCDTESTVDFLRKEIVKIDGLWENAKLEVKLLREIPALPKLYMTISMDDEDSKDKAAFGQMIIRILKRQNPTFAVDKWKILRIGDTIPGKGP